jgi:signal transduction histidine kinase
MPPGWEALRVIDRATLAASSAEAIARATLENLDRLIPADGAAVWVAGDGRELEPLVVGRGESLLDLPPERRSTLAELARSWSGDDRAALLIPDLQAARSLAPRLEGLRERGIGAYLGIPLLANEEVIGFLELVARGPGRLDKSHREIGREVADPLGVAIQQARLHEQVREGRRRLNRLSRRVLEIQEDERRHLARELHDEIGQQLTGLKLSLELAARLPADGLLSVVREASGLVNELMTVVRRLFLDLRPPMLDDLGLVPTLAWYVGRYSAQSTIPVSLQHSGLEGRRFALSAETAAYPFVQEALTNVRHSGARSAAIQAWADDLVLVVQVEDSGVGFDADVALAAGTTGGLSGMRDRATLAGCRLTVESRPGSGTRLAMELPLTGLVERRNRERAG